MPVLGFLVQLMVSGAQEELIWTKAVGFCWRWTGAYVVLVLFLSGHAVSRLSTYLDMGRDIQHEPTRVDQNTKTDQQQLLPPCREARRVWLSHMLKPETRPGWNGVI